MYSGAGCFSIGGHSKRKELLQFQQRVTEESGALRGWPVTRKRDTAKANWLNMLRSAGLELRTLALKGDVVPDHRAGDLSSKKKFIFLFRTLNSKDFSQ